MDIEGHQEDPRINEILNVMKHLCLHMKILGSYPMGEEKAHGEVAS